MPYAVRDRYEIFISMHILAASRRAKIQLKIGNRDSTREHSSGQACFPKYWKLFIEQTHLDEYGDTPCDP